MNYIKKMANTLKDSHELNKEYYTSEWKEIATRNLHMVRNLSLTVTLLYTILMLVTPVFLSSGLLYLNTQYLMGLLNISFLIIVELYLHKQNYNYIVAQWFVISYVMYLFTFLLMNDVFIYRNDVSSFVMVLFMIIPVIFTIPMTIQMPLIIICYVIYLVCIFWIKAKDLVYVDIYNSITPFICATVIAHITMRLRKKEFLANREYQRLSIEDGLTGIWNKSHFEKLATEYFSLPTNEMSAILLIDFDDFKSINDSEGHLAGDVALQQLGSALRDIVRPPNYVGRIGGDEFMVLLKDIEGISYATDLCADIQEATKPICVGPSRRHVSCCVGIIIVPKTPVDFEYIYQHADKAMYRAKGNGHGHVELDDYTLFERP